MKKDFDTDTKVGEWALILGGSSGLGLASAKKLAKHGINLCIIHRTRRSALTTFENAKKEIKDYKVDIKDFNIDALNPEKQAKIVGFLAENGIKISLLLHSIARGNLKPVYSKTNENVLSTEDFNLTLGAMATSLYTWVQLLVQNNLFSRPARILSFTSSGSHKALANYAAVGAAKAALEAITRSLAYELAPLKITANCIEAGITDTESLRLIPGSETLKKQVKKHHPYNRMTTAEDVANVVYLMTRTEANWINGTVIPVDGGEHLI